MSLNAWLNRFWNDAITDGRILSPVLISQEHAFALWEQIIQGSTAGKDILNVSGATELAQQAYVLMQLYAIAVKDLLPLGSVEARAYQQWSSQYQQKLEKEKWLDPAGLCSAVSQAVGSRTITPPAELYLYAMEDLRPVESELFDSLRNNGCTITELTTLNVQTSANKLVCAEVGQEIEFAAKWARQRLTEDPSARIGVVVPQLSGLRQTIERTFLFELQHTTFLDPDASDRSRAFEISLGASLSEHPLVGTALLLLRLACGKLALPELCFLLRSIYFAGGSEELCQRSLLEAELRKRNVLGIDAETLARIASETKNAATRTFSSPLLSASISGLDGTAKNERPAQHPSRWSRICLQLLEKAGWPGTRTLNSSEYQSHQKFKKLLTDLASLDAIHSTMDLSDAVHVLQSMAARQTFQPENLDAPAQVLGPLEAIGSHFDHLWVLGLNDETWPARGAPNPFLPLQLQRKHQMPHSSADLDLAFTQELTQRLLTSAPEVIVSHSTMDADRELRPSPLIDGLVPINASDLGLGSVTIQAAAFPSLTEWGDAPSPYPPLQMEETHHGGTRIFELQSACAFRAFAELRLGAVPLDEPSLGLDALDRGNLAHKVMYRIWNEIKDSRRLRELADDPAKFAECIRSNVQIVLQDEHSLRGGEWQRRFAQLEHDRLSHTVEKMLALDLERAQPFTVEHKEEKEQIELGGVRMNIRKDRVDTLDDGRSVIIDYKSGVKKVSAWKGERPEEPQLPVYALTTNGPLAAIAFANLKTGKEGYQGIAEADGILPDVKAGERSPLKTKFSGQVTAWRAPLEKLAADFIAGGASVAPKKRVETCKYCSLHTLCRIAELNPVDATSEDDNNGGDDHE